MPEQSNDYRVAVFGAGGVGKSSLVLRFVKGTFRESYIPTVEDTYRQVISCDKSICTLQITDTTGSHQFPAMQRLSISKGHAFILVYSITSRQSLEELKPIYEQICEIKGDVESIPIMLVGNKCDENPNREVESSEVRQRRCRNLVDLEFSSRWDGRGATERYEVRGSRSGLWFKNIAQAWKQGGCPCRSENTLAGGRPGTRTCMMHRDPIR